MLLLLCKSLVAGCSSDRRNTAARKIATTAKRLGVDRFDLKYRAGGRLPARWERPANAVPNASRNQKGITASSL
jgi:hypothetical protein